MLKALLAAKRAMDAIGAIFIDLTGIKNTWNVYAEANRVNPIIVGAENIVYKRPSGDDDIALSGD